MVIIRKCRKSKPIRLWLCGSQLDGKCDTAGAHPWPRVLRGPVGPAAARLAAVRAAARAAALVAAKKCHELVRGPRRVVVHADLRAVGSPRRLELRRHRREKRRRPALGDGPARAAAVAAGAEGDESEDLSVLSSLPPPGDEENGEEALTMFKSGGAQDDAQDDFLIDEMFSAM